MTANEISKTEHPGWKVQKSTILHWLPASIGLAAYGPKIEIQTDKQQAEITADLTARITPSSVAWMSVKDEYIGDVGQNNFQIHWHKGAAKNYGNAWVPILRGTIKPAEDGSIINAHFDLHLFSKVFLAFLLCSFIFCVALYFGFY